MKLGYGYICNMVDHEIGNLTIVKVICKCFICIIDACDGLNNKRQFYEVMDRIYTRKLPVRENYPAKLLCFAILESYHYLDAPSSFSKLFSGRMNPNTHGDMAGQSYFLFRTQKSTKL